MLDIVLHILTILGIILLVLLGIILLVLVLVFFFPVTYRIFGEKELEQFWFKVKAKWLFGLIRAQYYYPKPGKFVIKFLWITLYDSEEKEECEENLIKKGKDIQPENTLSKEKAQDTMPKIEEKISDRIGENEQADFSEETSPNHDNSPQKGIIKKIKYTILKIYDRIKHIWENVSFYKDLFAEEQTKELLQHAWKRLQRIWKNIHPRKIKTNLIFGADSPDATGYVLALYGILSPLLGRHVNITPDFTQAILLGDFYIAGHITIFQVLFHSLMVVFDKRLKRLNDKIKSHGK